MFNITTSRDERFYLNLFEYAYRQGYLRVSKHQHVLAVEGWNTTHLDTHLSLINQIANNLRHKGDSLQIRRFAVGDMTDAHLHVERNKLFPAW